ARLRKRRLDPRKRRGLAALRIPRRAGDLSHGASIVGRPVAGVNRSAGLRRLFEVERQTNQPLLYLAAHVLHAHPLLAEIAALGPRDGFSLEGGIMGTVRTVVIDAESREPELDAPWLPALAVAHDYGARVF